MTHYKNYENESQDARRRDKHEEVHPNEKPAKHHSKLKQDSSKHTSEHNKKK